MIDAALTVPALLLALVLIFSAVAKLAASSSAEDAFISLRLPAFLRRWKVPALLPWGELVLAVSLLVASGPFAVVVAVATLVLFVGYLVVIVRALTFDEPVRCSCFGELGLGDVTKRTAIRNLLLVALSVVVVWDALHGRSVIARVLDFSTAAWLWLIWVAVAIVLTYLITGHRPGAKASDAAAFGANSATWKLGSKVRGSFATVAGSARSLSDVTSPGRVTLLAFVSPSCGSCTGVIDRLRTWQRETSAVRVVLVLPADPRDDYYGLNTPEDFEVAFDPGTRTTSEFGFSTPTAIAVDSKTRLKAGPVVGKSAIDDLLRQLDASIDVPDEEPAGALAPTPSTTPAAPTTAASPTDSDDAADYLRAPNPYALLVDSADQALPLTSYAGPQTGPAIFIQVSPGCGSCESTLARVDEWRTQVAPISLFLIVTSTASRSILVDRGFDPKYVLVDENAALSRMMNLAMPGLFAAGADGLMLAGPVNGFPAVETTMDDIIAEVRGVHGPIEEDLQSDLHDHNHLDNEPSHRSHEVR